MTLSEYEKIVFSYYVEKSALDLKMVPRFWAYVELVNLIEDKVQLLVRKRGPNARKASGAVAKSFVDALIEGGGFSNVKNEFGGTMHQYQDGAYADCVKEIQKNDPIIQSARVTGDEYWDNSLA